MILWSRAAHDHGASGRGDRRGRVRRPVRGPALATAPGGARWATRRVIVLEARTGPDPRFRGELIHPPGVRVLAELRPARAAARRRRRRRGGLRGGARERARRPSRSAYTEVRGGAPRGLAISHPDMVARLRREVAARRSAAGRRVEMRTGVRVAELVYEGDRVVGVRTESGEEIRAPLTVVAEGRHSKLRRALGFADETRAALVHRGAPRPAASCRAPAYGHVFLGTWGPILAYAIGGGRVRMCVDLPVGRRARAADAVLAFLRDRVRAQRPRAAALGDAAGARRGAAGDLRQPRHQDPALRRAAAWRWWATPAAAPTRSPPPA